MDASPIKLSEHLGIPLTGSDGNTRATDPTDHTLVYSLNDYTIDPLEAYLYTQNAGTVGTGSVGHDIILGSGGVDTLKGQGGDDTAFGDFGDDSIRGGKGSDILWGNEGDDKDSLKGGMATMC